MSKLFKRSISMVLVLLCIITALPTINISAASSFTPDWDFSGIYAWETSTVATAGSEHIMLYVNAQPAYCIQPGHHYNESTDIVANASDTWKNLERETRNSIYLSMMNGAEGNLDRQLKTVF